MGKYFLNKRKKKKKKRIADVFLIFSRIKMFSIFLRIFTLFFLYEDVKRISIIGR